MAQTKEGALKVAAQKCGISVDEYIESVQNGLKRCYQCKTWKSIDDFSNDITRYDGKKANCATCCRVKTKKNTKGRVSTFKGKKHTQDAIEKMKKASAGNKNRLGKKHTIETRKKISDTKRERKSSVSGERHHAYKDGKLEERRGQRFSTRYKQWRYDVFLRDKFTCQSCGDSRGGNLRAHHKKLFSEYPELRFDTSNGVTLCDTCHKKIHYA